MASPNSTFTEIVSMTLRNHPSMIADNVSNNNALFDRLMRKGQVKTLDGGYSIVRILDYQENSTFQRYSGFDVLNVAATDVITSAEYQWKQAVVNVAASGRDLRMNSGEERITSFAAAKLKNAMRTMANNLSDDIYSTGAASNQIGGLQLIVANDGLGTVGGISANTYGFWANQVEDMTSTATSSTVKGFMNSLWLKTVRGSDKPDLIVSSNDIFNLYWASLQDLQRYTNNDNAKTATAGFQSLKYVTADYVHDGGSGIPSYTQYMLNTDYLEMCVHRDANMTEMDQQKSINQDAVVIPVIFMGNLVCSNRARQGVLADIT